MAQPWRFWLTGAAAVVWAAVLQMPAQAGSGVWASRESRHSVEETVRRIERGARERGLPVFAKCGPRPGQPCEDGDATVLVLASEEGQTPVVQPEPGAPLQLPLTVWVEPGGTGAKVRFGDPRRLAELTDLPPAVADRLAEVAGLVDDALAA
jgi:uncharacterized protein (DUF302 family)